LSIVKVSKKEKVEDYGRYYCQNNTPIVAIVVENVLNGRKQNILFEIA